MQETDYKKKGGVFSAPIAEHPEHTSHPQAEPGPNRRLGRGGADTARGGAGRPPLGARGAGDEPRAKRGGVPQRD